jgi:RNA polymerase sigma-70 factor (ECF subfamily)
MKDDIASARDLLARARQGDSAARGQLLELYRPRLHEMAARQLDGRVAVRVDPSDLIQQTNLEALRSFGQFLGQDEGQWVAWLQTILERRVALAIRDHALLQKRTVRREQSMDQEAGSESGLKQGLDAGYTPPSQQAMRLEEEARLARALDTLPADQREAVRLRHLERRPLADVARQLNRSRAATAGLIKRGLKALRRHFREGDE